MTTHRTTHLSALPYLFYDDPRAALSWLSDVFGLRERLRLESPTGFILHAEVELNGGVVMIGNVGARNRERPSTVRSSVYVFVDDVDAHYQHALRGGAEIVDAPADQPFGDRIYLAKDPEGHEWYSSQHIHDVAIEDLAARLFGREKR